MDNPKSDSMTAANINSERAFKYFITLSCLVLLVPLFYFVISGNYLPILGLLGLIVTTFLLLSPKTSYLLFFLSVSLFFPFTAGSIYIHPFDIVMAILILAVILDYILKGHHEIRPAVFDKQFGFLIGATFLSAAFAYNISYSLVPCLRIVLIYLAFRFTFKFAAEIGIRRLLQIFLALVAFLSIYNSALYLYFQGQERVFGLAWLSYELYAMTGLPMALAFFIYAKNNKERLYYALVCLVVGFGIIATQSRAPMLSVVLAVPTIIYFGYRKLAAEKGWQGKFHLKLFIPPLLILGILFILFKDSFFAGVMERYESFIASLSDPEGSIALRFVLWTAAFKAFLLDPLTGIGIGNFKLIVEIIPSVQVSPLWRHVANMSAHNVLLQYMAETGIFGAAALLLLAWKGLRSSVTALKEKISREDTQVAMAIFVAMFIFFVSLVYARDWTWGQGGYLLAFFFGLNAAWIKRK